VLSSLLNSEDVGFEWGSGRSTIWLAQRTKFLVSIENNIEWYNIVRSMLSERGIKNTLYEFQGDTRCSWRDRKDTSYVRSIEKIADYSLDYIVNDGYARDWCALKGFPKLKPGGVFILDDARRFLPSKEPLAPYGRTMRDGPASPEWETFLKIITPHRKIWTTDGVKDTLIIIKTS
jgi:predicted O-methyltransferase YrrM